MIAITFDSDHMDDVRMEEFMSSFNFPGKGTFFCTQTYSALESKKHELAPHPTLSAGLDWTDQLNKMREMYPESVGWRSHSCVFSHLLALWLSENGYVYASTYDQFTSNDIQPLRDPWGIWQMPIYYMDNMDFSRGQFWDKSETEPFESWIIEQALSGSGMYVFDFHPIHLMLNTPNSDYYFSKRDQFKSGEKISSLSYKGYGTANFFNDLVKEMKSASLISNSLSELVPNEVEYTNKPPIPILI